MEGYENHKWFEITDEAKNQMEKLLAKHPEKYAVSLEVQGGGCAGFKYEWGFADTKESVNTGDHVDVAPDSGVVQPPIDYVVETFVDVCIRDDAAEIVNGAEFPFKL